MARIIICAEIYSANLGDGVIADSLKWLLKQVDPSVEVCCIDFSDRQGFGAEAAVNSVKPNRLHLIHQSLARQSLYRKVIVLPVWYLNKRSKLNQVWREKIGEADLVLIGGGQLLMDNDLAFPLRVRELVKIAADLNRDVAIYACGVGEKWSRLGLQILEKTLADKGISWFSVRDTGSRNTLQTLVSHANLNCNISLDPAVCAAEAYGVTANAQSNLIGLNISAPSVLSRHIIAAKDAFAVKRVRQFWIELAELLVADDRQFVFFCNGLGDDYAFAESIVASIPKDKIKQPVLLLEKAREPRTLLTQVAQCQAIVAHRLHANIIAYSLGIPSVGLIWDKKVKEFGKITGRSNFYLEPAEMDPHITKQRLDEAINRGVDAVRLAEHKASAIRDIETMLNSVGITQLHRTADKQTV